MNRFPSSPGRGRSALPGAVSFCYVQYQTALELGHGRRRQRMFVAICLAALAAAVTDPAPGQTKVAIPAQVPPPQPVPMPPTPVGAASFRNDLKTPVVLQGVTRLPGNKQQRGAPIIIAPGKTVTEFNVPAGLRVHNIYDANQPARVLAREVQVGVLPGRPVNRIIQQLPNGQTVIVP